MKIFDATMVRCLLLTGLIVSVFVATDIARSQSDIPEDKRYAHRFFPPSVDWILETEIPVESTAPLVNQAHSHHLIAADPQKPLTEVIWEVSLYPPGTEPTTKEREAAQTLVERSYETATRNRWFDFDKARADGFVVSSQSHYVNEEYVFDDAILDPERPEFLMYYDTPEGKKFTGYMFLINEPLARGPQIAGPLTIWHYHIFSDYLCFEEGLIIVGLPENGKCVRGVPQRRSAEMLHVWLIDHPGGQFSSQMIFPTDTLMSALQRRFRERGY
ncbi:MAG TPA: hypothetical protein VFR18_10145 [Terriglobia bacterium]|nr:hypothetical protein [Terriglobia bacterium]